MWGKIPAHEVRFSTPSISEAFLSARSALYCSIALSKVGGTQLPNRWDSITAPQHESPTAQQLTSLEVLTMI